MAGSYGTVWGGAIKAPEYQKIIGPRRDLTPGSDGQTICRMAIVYLVVASHF